MVDIAKSIAQLKGDDLELRREAAESFAQMGEEASAAAVALVQACHTDDEILQEWVVAALEQLGPPRRMTCRRSANSWRQTSSCQRTGPPPCWGDLPSGARPLSMHWRNP